MVNTDNKVELESDYLEQWLETTHLYLFSDLEKLAGSEKNGLLESTLDKHGAQDRSIFRTRGRSLRLRLL